MCNVWLNTSASSTSNCQVRQEDKGSENELIQSMGTVADSRKVERSVQHNLIRLVGKSCPITAAGCNKRCCPGRQLNSNTEQGEQVVWQTVPVLPKIAGYLHHST